MAALLIKNFPDGLKRRLKREAERNRRSMNQQALLLIEQGLRPIMPINFPTPIKSLRPISGQEVIRVIRRARDARS